MTRTRAARLLATSLLPALAALGFQPADAPDQSRSVVPFAVEVVDDVTGRGVPLVELETVNHIKLYTDSNGLAVLDEPGFEGRAVYLHVRAHGYAFPADGFGYRGARVEARAGTVARLKLKRVNVAERLYRVTGAGVYADTVRLGRRPPTEHPLLNAGVLGSDSVLTAVFQGKIRWFWGDTNRLNYPLGNFHTPGAVSMLPDRGGLDPSVGVNLDYLADPDGFAAATARLPGDGPTWLFGLVALRDRAGAEHLYASYSKIKPPLDAYERGLVEFNPAEGVFEKRAGWPMGRDWYPDEHPFLRRQRGRDDVYFPTPFPLTRVTADLEHLKDLASYESFTCLAAGSTLKHPRIERDDHGNAVFAWKRDAPALQPDVEARLVKEGLLRSSERLTALRDVETGRRVQIHRGSVNWNAHRRRWIMIATEIGGTTSLLGEIWYAEADTPLGPWAYARKVVTHDKYSFYNPRHHPFFDQDGGRLVYFEGTYTNSFSGNPVMTPRYDYNQVMYRLDLDDPRLNLPVAFESSGVRHLDGAPRRADFFALERNRDGAIAILDAARKPLCYALPLDMKDPPPHTTPLHAYRHAASRRLLYSTDADLVRDGYARLPQPLGRVWINPVNVALPD